MQTPRSGKPEERSGAEENGYHREQGKCEIETAEAETINGDAVGADRVVGERSRAIQWNVSEG